MNHIIEVLWCLCLLGGILGLAMMNMTPVDARPPAPGR
jgi:hypothetical protein